MREKHGMARTPTYRSWIAMRTRCLNPNRSCFKNYGGRGIAICESWNSFEAFFADMGVRPEGTSLDRINNDGNYEPGNCRWATAVEQGRNTRRANKASFGGENTSIPEIAEKIGISASTLQSRVTRHGVDKAVAVSIASPGLLKERTSPDGIWAQDGDDTPYIGSKWASLTVIRRTRSNARGRIFLCECDCGELRETNLGFLVKGYTVSCGCTTRRKASEHAHRLNERRMSL